jgi:hypothetical protein
MKKRDDEVYYLLVDRAGDKQWLGPFYTALELVEAVTEQDVYSAGVFPIVARDVKVAGYIVDICASEKTKLSEKLEEMILKEKGK